MWPLKANYLQVNSGFPINYVTLSWLQTLPVPQLLLQDRGSTYPTKLRF